MDTKFDPIAALAEIQNNVLTKSAEHSEKLPELERRLAEGTDTVAQTVPVAIVN